MKKKDKEKEFLLLPQIQIKEFNFQGTAIPVKRSSTGILEKDLSIEGMSSKNIISKICGSKARITNTTVANGSEQHICKRFLKLPRGLG